MGIFDSIGDIFSSDPAETKQESTSTTGPDPKVKEAASGALDRAETLSNKAFTPLDPASKVADLGAYDDAFKLMGTDIGGYKPDIDAAKGVAKGYATGDTGIYDNINKYMNPWENQVVQNTVDEQNRVYDMADRKANSAIRANIGSAADPNSSGRWGQMGAEMTRGRAKVIGDTVANLRSQGFNTAAGMSAADAAAKMGGANTLTSMLASETGLKAADVNQLLTKAGIVYQNNQLMKNAQTDEFFRQLGYDDAQLDKLYARINSTNMGTTGTSNSTSTYDPGGNDFMRWAGLGIAATGAAMGGGVSGNPGNPVTVPQPSIPAYNYERP